MMHCALTGHRDLPPDFDKNKLYDVLEELVSEGYGVFYCGMAEGFDLLALDCLAALKEKYPLRIVACIPFRGQENGFSPAERKKYRELIGWCDEKTELFPSYRNGCYLARNRYMVDKADALLAYCNRDTGGSAYTVQYARRTGKKVILFGEDVPQNC